MLVGVIHKNVLFMAGSRFPKLDSFFVDARRCMMNVTLDCLKLDSRRFIESWRSVLTCFLACCLTVVPSARVWGGNDDEVSRDDSPNRDGFVSVEFSTDSINIVAETKLIRYEYLAEKMGVPVRVILYADDKEKADSAVEAVWARFDDLNSKLSDYDPESEIIQVCRKAGESGKSTPISDELRAVLVESRRYCALTEGAFDITVSPIVKLWRRSRYFHQLPPEKTLASAKKNVGLDVWSLDNFGVNVRENVRFDVGGIAKGTALDDALKTLQEKGIRSALIDASGDIRLGDAPPGKEGWIVGVASLNDEPVCYCELSNVGICCSGDANRYVEIDGVRYSHIVDPRTCEPLTRRCVASVIAPTATTADALASALCVLGGDDFAKVAERARKTDLSASEFDRSGATEPLEYLLIQVFDDAEPPYTPDNTRIFASPFFQRELKKERQ